MAQQLGGFMDQSGTSINIATPALVEAVCNFPLPIINLVNPTFLVISIFYRLPKLQGMWVH